MDDDSVEAGICERQLIHVAEAHDAIAQSGTFKVDARDRQHLARLIDAEGLRDARAQNLDHAAGAGADIEQILRCFRGNDLDQRRLDLALVDVERADAVPMRGVFAEIGRGKLGALALDRGQPLEIERERFVGFVAGSDELPRQGSRCLAGAEAVKNPAALAKSVEEPGFAKELQMTRDPRLALAENLRELANGKLAAGAED